MPIKSAVEKPIADVNWQVVWDPASKEFAALAKAEAFHHLDIEDTHHPRKLARVVERDGYTFVVAKTIIRDTHTNRLEFGDFNLFIKPDALITVMEQKCSVVEDAVGRLEASSRKDVAHIVYTLLDVTVDAYLVALDALGQTLQGIEEQVLRKPTPVSLQRIFHTKRSLVDFRRNAASMREMVNAILRTPHAQGNKELASYYRDLYDHVVLVIELIETYRDLLTGILDMYLSVVANRTTMVMKILALYGTIALPLVVITGFYGMNIGLPFQHHPLAVVGVSIFMALFVAVMLAYFRWKEWL